MAVKYLAGERLIGTAAERAALTTGSPTYETDTFSGWSESGMASIGSNSGGVSDAIENNITGIKSVGLTLYTVIGVVLTWLGVKE